MELLPDFLFGSSFWKCHRFVAEPSLTKAGESGLLLLIRKVVRCSTQSALASRRSRTASADPPFTVPAPLTPRTKPVRWQIADEFKSLLGWWVTTEMPYFQEANPPGQAI
jgi:hypothetical protein